MQDNANSPNLSLVRQATGLWADGLGKYLDRRRVVRNVSLHVQRGEAIGLLGPNGLARPPLFICSPA